MENVKQIREFLKFNRYNIFCTIIVALVIYFVKLTQYSISIDTEVMIVSPESLLNSWYGLGRFGLCFIKELFHLVPITIKLANVMAFILLLLSSIVWLFNFSRLLTTGQPNKRANLFFLLLIISSPILAEQMGFTLQNFEIMLAFFLEGIAVIFINLWIERRSICYGVLGMLLLVISFACYQAFIILYIMTCIMSYFIVIEQNSERNLKEECVRGIKYIIILIIAFFLYEVINIYVNNIMDIPENTYLKNQIMWGTEPVVQTIFNISKNIAKSILGIKTIYHPFVILFAIVFIKTFINEHKFNKNDFLNYIALIGLLICPYIITILTGSDTAGRAQFGLVYLLAFMVWYIVTLVIDYRKLKIISIIAMLTIFIQSSITGVLLYSARNCYVEEVKMAEQINDSVIKKDFKGKRLAFIGAYNPNKILKGETLGRSFFEWDESVVGGCNYRVNTFLRTLGYEYEVPAIDEISALEKKVSELPTWKENQSVYIIDGIAVVKLSDV